MVKYRSLMTLASLALASNVVLNFNFVANAENLPSHMTTVTPKPDATSVSNKLVTLSNNVFDVNFEYFAEDTLAKWDTLEQSSKSKASQHTKEAVQKLQNKLSQITTFNNSLATKKKWQATSKNTSDSNKKWTISLSKDVENTLDNKECVHVFDPFGEEVAVTVEINNNKITVKPQKGYKKGITYTLVVDQTLKSTKGKALKNAIYMPFAYKNAVLIKNEAAFEIAKENFVAVQQQVENVKADYMVLDDLEALVIGKKGIKKLNVKAATSNEIATFIEQIKGQNISSLSNSEKEVILQKIKSYKEETISRLQIAINYYVTVAEKLSETSKELAKTTNDLKKTEEVQVLVQNVKTAITDLKEATKVFKGIQIEAANLDELLEEVEKAVVENVSVIETLVEEKLVEEEPTEQTPIVPKPPEQKPVEQKPSEQTKPNEAQDMLDSKKIELTDLINRIQIEQANNSDFEEGDKIQIGDITYIMSYSPESIQAPKRGIYVSIGYSFKDALQEVKSILKNDNATFKEINDAIAQLNQAIAELNIYKTNNELSQLESYINKLDGMYLFADRNNISEVKTKLNEYVANNIKDAKVTVFDIRSFGTDYDVRYLIEKDGYEKISSYKTVRAITQTEYNNALKDYEMIVNKVQLHKKGEDLAIGDTITVGEETYIVADEKDMGIKDKYLRLDDASDIATTIEYVQNQLKFLEPNPTGFYGWENLVSQIEEVIYKINNNWTNKEVQKLRSITKNLTDYYIKNESEDEETLKASIKKQFQKEIGEDFELNIRNIYLSGNSVGIDYQIKQKSTGIAIDNDRWIALISENEANEANEARKSAEEVLASIKIKQANVEVEKGDTIQIDNEIYKVSNDKYSESISDKYIDRWEASSFIYAYKQLEEVLANKSSNLNMLIDRTANLTTQKQYLANDWSNKTKYEYQRQSYEFPNVYVVDEEKNIKEDIEEQLQAAVDHNYKVIVTDIKLRTDYQDVYVVYEITKYGSEISYSSSTSGTMYTTADAGKYMSDIKVQYTEIIKADKTSETIKSGDAIVINGETYYILTYPNTASKDKKAISLYQAQEILQYLDEIKAITSVKVLNKFMQSERGLNNAILSVKTNWTNELKYELTNEAGNLYDADIVLKQDSIGSNKVQIEDQLQELVAAGFIVTIKNMYNIDNGKYIVYITLSKPNETLTYDMSIDINVLTADAYAQKIAEAQNELKAVINRVTLPTYIDEGEMIKIDGEIFGISGSAASKEDGNKYLTIYNVQNLISEYNSAVAAVKKDDLTIKQINNFKNNLDWKIANLKAFATNSTISNLENTINRIDDEIIELDNINDIENVIREKLKTVLGENTAFELKNINYENSNDDYSYYDAVVTATKNGFTVERYISVKIYTEVQKQRAIKNIREQLTNLLNTISFPEKDDEDHYKEGSIFKIGNKSAVVFNNPSILSGPSKYLDISYVKSIAEDKEQAEVLLLKEDSTYVELNNIYSIFNRMESNLEYYMTNKDIIDLQQYYPILRKIPVVGVNGALNAIQIRDNWLSVVKQILPNDIKLEADIPYISSNYAEISYTLSKENNTYSSWVTINILAEDVNEIRLQSFYDLVKNNKVNSYDYENFTGIWVDRNQVSDVNRKVNAAIEANNGTLTFAQLIKIILVSQQ